MTTTMTKLFLALCLSASALVGCGGDPAEDGAGEANSAGSDAVEGQELNAEAIRYISYEALNKGKVGKPCPDVQVYDVILRRCVTKPANIYTRGCSAITHCRRA